MTAQALRGLNSASTAGTRATDQAGCQISDFPQKIAKIHTVPDRLGRYC
jgi:hypothetical protein